MWLICTATVININFEPISPQYWHKENSLFSSPLFVAPVRGWGEPSEFLDETYPEKTTSMGENCMIATVAQVMSYLAVEWQQHDWS